MRKIIGCSLLFLMAFTKQPLHSSDQPQIHYLRKFTNFKYSRQSNNDEVNVPIFDEVQVNDNKGDLLQSEKGAVLLTTEQKPIEVKTEQTQENQKNQSLEKIMNTIDKVNNLRSEQRQKQAQISEQNQQLNVSQAVLGQSKQDQQKVLNQQFKQSDKHKNHNHIEQQQSVDEVPIFNQDFPSLSDFKNDHFQQRQNP